MKRILVCLMAAVLVMTAAPGAAAASGNKYELPELNMSIEVPDGWLVWTRDTAPDDSLLQGTGFNTAEVRQQMGSISAYLMAVEQYSGNQLKVALYEDEDHKYIWNLMTCSELIKGTYEMAFSAKLAAAGYTVNKVTRYEHSGALFIVLDTTFGTTPTMIYATVMNGQEISVMLQSYTAFSLQEKDINALKEMVDSIVFSVSGVNAVPEVQLPQTTATLDIGEIGITLDVPAGWLAFTRDVAEDDPGLYAIGTSAARLRKSMKEDGMFASLYNPELSAEVLIVVQASAEEAEISGINQWNSAKAKRTLDSIKRALQDTDGIDFISGEFHENSSMKYLACDYTIEQHTLKRYVRYYLTELDNDALSILLNVYSGEMTDSISEGFGAIVASLRPLGAERDQSAAEQDNSTDSVTNGTRDSQNEADEGNGLYYLSMVVITGGTFLYLQLRKRKESESDGDSDSDGDGGDA